MWIQGVSFDALTKHALKEAARRGRFDVFRRADTGELPERMRFFESEPVVGGKKVLLLECGHRDATTGRCEIYANRPQACRDYQCAALRGEVDLATMLEQGRTMPLPSEPVDVTRQVAKAMRR